LKHINKMTVSRILTTAISVITNTYSSESAMLRAEAGYISRELYGSILGENSDKQ
jgi:hypothetical protein